MKILITCESPFTERDFKRFSVDELIEEGWEVLVLDMTSLVSKQPRSNSVEPPSSERLTVIQTESVSSFYQLIKRFRPDFVIDLICDRINKKAFFKKFILMHLIRSRSRRIVFSLGSLPVAEPARVKWMKRGFYSALRYLSRPTKKDLLFTGGTAGTEGITSDILHGYSFDVNAAIREEAESQQRKTEREEYILYIDQNSPHSGDRKHMGLENPYCAESYYNEVSRMIHLAEERFDIKVKVQGHPRACISVLRKQYGARLLTGVSTSAAIRESKMVIGHNSTALQLAVFYKKPLIFATLDEIERADGESRKSASIKLFADLLGCKVNRFSTCTNEWPGLEAGVVDEEKYESYIERYSTVRKGERLSNGKILSNHLLLELKKIGVDEPGGKARG